MTLQAGRQYEIRINNLAGGMNSISSFIDNCRFFSDDIFLTTNEYSTENLPMNEGGSFVGNGYRESRSVTLRGYYQGLVGTANDAYPAAHLQAFHNIRDKLNYFRDTDMFIDIELEAGASSIRRLFVKPIKQRYTPIEGARYTMGEVSLTFLAADPDWYKSTTGSITGSGDTDYASGIGSISCTFPTNMFTVRITNIDASASLVNPSASISGTSLSWSISGSLSASGDYWEVDHYKGTVTKSVGGTTSSDIGNFTGSFWPLEEGNGYPILVVDCASGNDCDLETLLTYRLKADYNV